MDREFHAPARSSPTALVYGWYVVGLLAALYALSFIDRFMLTLAVDPVSRELGIGDAQIGLLFGAGFSLVYALGGLPIAQMLDRRERRPILAAGVALWSAATLASAFAGSFATLALYRAGVALGEAALTPAAISLIADLFPREGRALPVSVYAATSSVMSTGALIIDGAALQIATAWQPSLGAAPWRTALFLVGVPGLVLAIVIWFTLREPARTGSHAGPSPFAADDTSVSAFVHYLRRQWKFYLPYYFGTGVFAMYSFALLSWVPTLMMRRYGFQPAQAGYLLGAVGAPVTLLGTFFWPWLAARLERHGRRDGIMIAYTTAALIAVPFMVAAPLANSPALLLAGLGIAMPCLNTVGVLTPLAVQAYGPNRMRARLAALTLLSINLVGYALGPQFLVWISKHWANDPHGLSYGLAILGLACGPLSAGAIALSRGAVLHSSLLAERD
jgi:MFS family permease